MTRQNPLCWIPLCGTEQTPVGMRPKEAGQHFAAQSRGVCTRTLTLAAAGMAVRTHESTPARASNGVNPQQNALYDLYSGFDLLQQRHVLREHVLLLGPVLRLQRCDVVLQFLLLQRHNVDGSFGMPLKFTSLLLLSAQRLCSGAMQATRALCSAM